MANQAKFREKYFGEIVYQAFIALGKRVRKCTKYHVVHIRKYLNEYQTAKSEIPEMIQ